LHCCCRFLALKSQPALPKVVADAAAALLEIPTMLQYFLWVSLTLAGGVAGWMACAWLYRQRIQVLQLQMRVMRQTMSANTDQARRQIGQLQAGGGTPAVAGAGNRGRDRAREDRADGRRHPPAAVDA
jgi:hypothetical protein